MSRVAGSFFVKNRICHLIDLNQETAFFTSIARRHDRERFPVLVGSIAPAGALQEAMRRLDTPTFALGATSRRGYGSALARLVRLLRRERIGILHSHCFDPTLMGLAAARLAGVKFVFTRHHSDHHIRIDRPVHVRLDAYSARFADHVIAVSEATRQIMVEVEGVPERQITVVYNGMEPLREPTPEDVARVGRELGLAPEGRVCLMMARLHEEKGHKYLFDAISRVVSEVGRVVFLLAGAGSDRGRLEEDVARRGLNEYVRFLGRRDDVPELIALSTLVVLPSLAESFGYASLEAMSFGKPVVATAVGGTPEVVADGETGLLVPPRDAPRLADALCRVLKDADLRRSLGEAGRSRAARFTFDNMIGGYETVYARVGEMGVARRVGALGAEGR